MSWPREQIDPILRKLLASGKVGGKQARDFEDMLSRTSQKVFSPGQYKYIRGVALKIMGPDWFDEQVDPPKDRYKNCDMIGATANAQIRVFWKEVGPTVTKYEGRVILRWLTQALPEIMGVKKDPGPSRKEEEVDRNKQELEDLRNAKRPRFDKPKRPRF